MMGGGGPLIQIRGGVGPDGDSDVKQRIRPGIVRRILPYARPYRWRVAMLLFFAALDAVIIVLVYREYRQLRRERARQRESDGPGSDGTGSGGSDSGS